MDKNVTRKKTRSRGQEVKTTASEMRTIAALGTGFLPSESLLHFGSSQKFTSVLST